MAQDSSNAAVKSTGKTVVLPMTPEAREMFQGAAQAAERTNREFNLLYAMVLRNNGMTRATYIGMSPDGGVIVSVPEEKKD